MSVIEYVKEIREVIHIDTLMNLQALIVEQLRKYGVKVPYGVDFCSMRAPITHNREIRHFNNFLGHVPCYYLESFGHIPTFLVRASEVITKNINVEGIFRKSGSITRQKKLAQDIEFALDISSANVFDVTGLIKQFFRDLKEPLLTNAYHNAFLKCQQMRENGAVEKGTKAALKLCLLIPPEHLGTLKFTMNLFATVAAHSAHNKMTIRNLALIMAPSIMHSCPKGNKMTGEEEKLLPLQTSLLELLISQNENIGFVSINLCDQAKEMATFFNDMSPHKYNEMVASQYTAPPKKKQQRRSGSLQDFVSNIANRVTRWRQNGASSSSSLSSSEESLATVEQQVVKTEVKEPSTPVILGKRKSASGVTDTAMSASKRKARILGDQPLLPSTPRLEVKVKPGNRRSRSLGPNERLPISPAKKAKTKPFFQSLCSSKNSKKIEEAKSKAGKSDQISVAATAASKDRSRQDRKSSGSVRQRKRSASPFQRFLKRRKDDWSVSKIPVKEKKVSSIASASVSLVTCTKKSSGESSSYTNIPKGPVKEKQLCSKNQLQNCPKTVVLPTTEENESDSDQSDAGFSTISGGTVIFVPHKQRVDLSGETFEKNMKGSIDKTLSKRDLVLCDHSVQSRKPPGSPVSRRTRSRSIDNGQDVDVLYPPNKRSCSASEIKRTHRPNAVASFKVTNETKKILQRAQVPSKNLIQPGIISTPQSSSIDKGCSVRRASSANESIQPCNIKEHAVRRTSSFTNHKENSALPVLKSDILKSRMLPQNQENVNNGPSPIWSRSVNRENQPYLKRNISEVDNSCKTPKCTRLRRVSNPFPASTTPTTPASSRKKTEYKQMIKACLNSPNLHKHILPHDLEQYRLPESEFPNINFDFLANQHKYLIRQLKSMEEPTGPFTLPRPEYDLNEVPQPSFNHLDKENDLVFISPAPIVKYRQERLPMFSIDNEDCDSGNTQPSPGQCLDEVNPEDDVPIVYIQKDPKPLPTIQNTGYYIPNLKRVTPWTMSYYKQHAKTKE